MKKIGVIGCGGTIGPIICSYLSSANVEIIGGQRSEPDFCKYPENFRWKHLDINDGEELSDFCGECDVVLNCAGPAYVLFEKVALASARAGAVYVDVTDALMFNDEVMSRVDGKGKFYIAAGYYPGITGVMLKKVIEQFDRIDSLTGYSGGSEIYSVMSYLDIIMSGSSPRCINGYYKNGKPVKCGNGFESCDNELFDKKIMMKQFLGNELYSALKTYPDDMIEECRWYNITSDNVVGLMAMKYYQLCNEMDFHQLYSELSKYLEKIETKTPNDEWSLLYIIAKGIKDDEIKNVKLRIDLKNTMDITAYSAASVILAVLERNDDIGIYWANDILSENIMDDYRKKCKEKGIYCGWQFDEEYEI